MIDQQYLHYDVIIIGAGSIGTPTAYNLAKAGISVLVIDQEASVGQGSNKRAIGGVRATHSDSAKIHLTLRSLEIFSTWKERFGDDIEWYKGGYTFVAYRDEEENTLKELTAVQKHLGLNVEWLDRQLLLELIPDINPNELHGGTYSPDDGNVSSLLAVHAFYRQAIALGAEFRFNEQLENILVSGGKIQGVRTNKGRYSADIVINAAGAQAHAISSMVGLNTPVYPDSHEAAITEPVTHFLDPMVVDIRPVSGSSNYYFYQHITGQILFCITPSPNIWGENTDETSSFLPLVSKRIISIMPKLKNIRVRRTWRGLYPMTPDGFPIVGFADKEMEGYLLAVGMCGQGLMLGPGIGELITRIVQNNLSNSDLEDLTYLSPYREFVGQEKLK